MRSLAQTLAVLLAVGLLADAPPAQTAALAPERIPGLVAWYDIDTLHARLRHGSKVDTWEDRTADRHDLIFDGTGKPATMESLQINNKPVFRVREGNLYKVFRPFELDDHTIFIVHATEAGERALFRSDEYDNRGIVLHHGGRSHQYRRAGQVSGYNAPMTLSRDFSITVLGRDAGLLTAFVNGADVSSLSKMTEPIRVGEFFQIAFSRYVRKDGAGLKLAEMVFFDRYLTGRERDAVSLYLSDKYDIPLEADSADAPAIIAESAVRARLSTTIAVNVNEELVPISWDVHEKVEPPFRLDADSQLTALYCDRDGTRARVEVSLPLRTEVETASIRLFILINGETYHPEQAESVFKKTQSGRHGDARLEATLTLDAGDYLEIITSRSGGEGTVLLEPGKARLVVAKLR